MQDKLSSQDTEEELKEAFDFFDKEDKGCVLRFWGVCLGSGTPHSRGTTAGVCDAPHHPNQTKQT